MISEISSFGYACMLAKIFFYQGLAPLGPGLATLLLTASNSWILKVFVAVFRDLPLYNNVTSVSVFIGCWPWSIKGHTHRWRQIHVSVLVFVFSCLQNSSINHLNFYCIKQNNTGVPKKMPSTQFCGAAILIAVQGVNCYTKPKGHHSRFIVWNLTERNN